VNETLSLANLHPSEIAAVPAQGQTLYQQPPNTIQSIDPTLVAAEVGCAVVSDFRRADCAAGGQGAPLVPFADYILFRDAKKNRVLLNLGGIANITWLPATGTRNDIIGFDIGPANCVIDYLARGADLLNGIDPDGSLSMTGNASFKVAFLAIRNWKDVFKKPPKSADTPEMIDAFERALAIDPSVQSLPDKLATACLMTALGIGLALPHLEKRPDEIIASGGGVRNRRLMQEIRQSAQLPVLTSDEFGVPSDAKEAIAFALLGAATLDGVPSNIPSVTGARRSVVLGSITPKP
jgi:anhydro-N-acetylmuramic acid kinase